MDFEAVRSNQFKVITSGKPIEYVFWHRSPSFSFYNYYPTYAKALLEAVKPRYWRGHTVILVRLKPEKIDPAKFDSIT